MAPRVPGYVNGSLVVPAGKENCTKQNTVSYSTGSGGGSLTLRLSGTLTFAVRDQLLLKGRPQWLGAS